MAVTFDDVAAIVATLPAVVENEKWGGRTWTVAGKVFAWERGYSKADMKRFAAAGETPPAPPLLAVRTEDLHHKEAVLAAGHKGVFTIEHFNGYPGVLLHLKTAGKRTLKTLVIDAYLAMAPLELADEYLTTAS